VDFPTPTNFYKKFVGVLTQLCYFIDIQKTIKQQFVHRS